MTTSTCPVFHPTLEEFGVGIEKYVESVEPLVRPHGICKVIPPEGWWEAPNYDTLIQQSTKHAIPCPVKQCVSGARGSYALTLMERPGESLSSFKKKSDASALSKLPADLLSRVVVDTMTPTSRTVPPPPPVSTASDAPVASPSPSSPLQETARADAFAEYQESVSVEQRVRKFWRTLSPHMDPPIYGADALGSLFGGDPAYGWNPNKLNSRLRRYSPPIQGVTSAMLYAGQWAAMFAFHVEDMNLYSVNYLHCGAPKSWYSVPPSFARRFEAMAASQYPEDHAECTEFLRHKRYLFSPGVLEKGGISYDTVLHQPGEFIVTFPMSYHAGFNHGFNLAESSNFATSSWSRGAGALAGVCECQPDSVHIDLWEFTENERTGNRADLEGYRYPTTFPEQDVRSTTPPQQQPQGGAAGAGAAAAATLVQEAETVPAKAVARKTATSPKKRSRQIETETNGADAAQSQRGPTLTCEDGQSTPTAKAAKTTSPGKVAKKKEVREGATAAEGQSPSSQTTTATTGKWTELEHQVFLKALRRHGKEWKQVAAMVQTRTVEQARSHAQNYFRTHRGFGTGTGEGGGGGQEEGAEDCTIKEDLMGCAGNASGGGGLLLTQQEQEERQRRKKRKRQQQQQQQQQQQEDGNTRGGGGDGGGGDGCLFMKQSREGEQPPLEEPILNQEEEDRRLNLQLQLQLQSAPKAPFRSRKRQIARPCHHQPQSSSSLCFNRPPPPSLSAAAASGVLAASSKALASAAAARSASLVVPASSLSSSSSSSADEEILKNSFPPAFVASSAPLSSSASAAPSLPSPSSSLSFKADVANVANPPLFTVNCAPLTLNDPTCVPASPAADTAASLAVAFSPSFGAGGNVGGGGAGGVWPTKRCEKCECAHDGSFGSGRFCSAACRSRFNGRGNATGLNAAHLLGTATEKAAAAVAWPSAAMAETLSLPGGRPVVVESGAASTKTSIRSSSSSSSSSTSFPVPTTPPLLPPPPSSSPSSPVATTETAPTEFPKKRDKREDKREEEEVSSQEEEEQIQLALALSASLVNPHPIATTAAAVNTTTRHNPRIAPS